MHKLFLPALLAATLYGGTITINFDNLNNGDVVTNQYAPRTRSSPRPPAT